MRFEEKIATVMALPTAQPSARSIQWRQLVDLLAQRRDGLHSDAIDDAFDFLRSQREAIDLALRTEVAQSLLGRAVAADLLAVLAEDRELDPALIDALQRQARDPAAQPAPLTGRRSDDRVATPSPAARRGEAQIRDLAARIDAYRSQDAAPAPAAGRVRDFRWEAGTDGLLNWVEGAPRGPLIGQSIASVGDGGPFGIDGQAAGAFARRDAFRDARLSVAGIGPAAGRWRISGVPFFDPQSGRFLGYRGTARRPRIDEDARRLPTASPVIGLFGTDIPAESLRQLTHELRTPLNAISGFADMIDGQYMGPVGAAYRLRANQIKEQADRLLTAIDDLDTAARIETNRLSPDEGSADAGAVLTRLQPAYGRLAAERDARLVIEITDALPLVQVEADGAERMIARMLAATIGVAQAGETIVANLGEATHRGRPMLRLAIDRPVAIATLAEDDLLDPGYSPAGDWPGAPLLGLGFALRLVRNLATAVDGALVVEDRRFALYLPV